MLLQDPLSDIDPDEAPEKGNPHARREEYTRTVLDELLNPLHIHARLLPADHLLLEEEEERDCAAEDVRRLDQPVARCKQGHTL